MTTMVHQGLRALLPPAWRQTLRRLPDMMRHGGLRFYCPFCHWSYRNFRPRGQTINQDLFQRYGMVGGGLREHCECPGCHSHDRERLLYLFLRQRTDLFDPSIKRRVLHSAPESNLRRVLQSQPHLDYLDVDRNPQRARQAVDLTSMPFADGSFDVVISCHVIQEIPDDRAAMREIYRVLAPGGWAIVQAPVGAKLERTIEDDTAVTGQQQWERFGDVYFRRVYGRDYPQRWEEVGFIMQVHPFARELGADTRRRMSLLEDEVVYVAHRPRQGA